MVQQVMKEERVVPVSVVDPLSGDEGEAVPQLERNQREAGPRSRHLLLLTTDSACALQSSIIVITELVVRLHVPSRIHSGRCIFTFAPFGRA